MAAATVLLVVVCAWGEQVQPGSDLHSPQCRNTNSAVFIEAIMVLIFSPDVQLDYSDSDFSLRVALLVYRRS